jgi:hypothetical protein
MAKIPDDLEAVRAVAAALDGFSADDQERIIRWAREKLGLAPAARAMPNAQTPQPAPLAVSARAVELIEPTQPQSPARNIKTFVIDKNPKNDIQFAATVAYFYHFEAPPEQKKEEIDAAILQDACRLAGRERFTDPRKTLQNAKQQGLLDSGSEAGKFTINTVGENLVAMTLPSRSDGPMRGTKPTKLSKKTTKKKK